MTKFFQTDQKNQIRQIDAFAEGCWIDLVNPSDDEVEDVCAASGLPDEMVKAALDEEERARVESDDGCNLFILDTPLLMDTDGGDMYLTIPLGILYNEKCVVTVSLRGNPILKDFMSKRTKIDTTKPVGFVLQFMLENAKRFLFSLRQIDKMSSRIQEELQKSMKNKDLMRLLDLQNSLVYFSTSLNSNMNVHIRAEKMPAVRQNEAYQDLFEDVVIETKQAIETCNIYRDILTVTMEAFSSVISNSANNVMRLLTILTVVVAIPTLVAGLWGMNMEVPFQHETGTWAWWLVTILSLVGTAVAAVLMFKFSATGRIDKASRKQKRQRKK